MLERRTEGEWPLGSWSGQLVNSEAIHTLNNDNRGGEGGGGRGKRGRRGGGRRVGMRRKRRQKRINLLYMVQTILSCYKL